MITPNLYAKSSQSWHSWNITESFRHAPQILNIREADKVPDFGAHEGILQMGHFTRMHFPVCLTH